MKSFAPTSPETGVLLCIAPAGHMGGASLLQVAVLANLSSHVVMPYPLDSPVPCARHSPDANVLHGMGLAPCSTLRVFTVRDMTRLATSVFRIFVL
jgi:hypothetical protein